MNDMPTYYAGKIRRNSDIFQYEKEPQVDAKLLG